MAEDEIYELPSIDEAPWLIGTHENKKATLEKQTFFSMNNNTSYVKKIVELHGKSIVASSMGWLILRERVNLTMYSLWNPITRQSIILPELLGSPEGEPDCCILTSPPYEDGFDNTTKCVLFLIFKGVLFWCRISTKKDDFRWVKQCLMLDGLSVNLNEVAILNGDLYAYAYYTDDSDNEVNNEENDEVDNEENDGILFVRLKVSEDNDGSLNSVLIERLSAGYPFSSIVYNLEARKFYYLVEVCGELYAVNIIPRQVYCIDGYDIIKAFVWKLDLSEMKWIQVESLGNRSLLLSLRCCSTWCWAYESHGQIEGNCIYVANYRREYILHQYRLQDNSYTLVSSHSNFCFCSSGPIWFMPHNPTRLSSLVGEREQIIVENTKHVELLEETSAEIPASSLLQLPPEIMITIADRMHWFDCMNYRATSKMMRSEIPKPQFKANSPFPLFMFLSNTQGICELWDPCYQNNGSITKKLPYSTLIVSKIEFCKDDWLMLSSHEGCYLQYMNIFTGERCKYPTKSLSDGFLSFAFSTCPTSPDCLTVGIKCPYDLTINLLQAGDDEWEVFEFEVENNDSDFSCICQSSPKYHNGAFYFLGVDGNLGVFKIIDGEWELETHKGPLQSGDFSIANECYIAELDGQLICIFIKAFGSSIKVYNFDTNQKLWVELKSLGDYTLFVSSASSFSVPTKDSSMRNRIYLPKRIGNEMVFYSLDTGKYHTSSSKDSFENFCGMNSQLFCCWV